MIIRILLRILLFLLILVLVFFLNTGFVLDSYWKIAQIVIFTITFYLILFMSKIRRLIFIISLILVIIMGILYVFNLIEWSEIFGSTGIGLIIINLITYLSQLVKLGYIKKI